jgi:hypothetical protein
MGQIRKTTLQEEANAAASTIFFHRLVAAY